MNQARGDCYHDATLKARFSVLASVLAAALLLAGRNVDVTAQAPPATLTYQVIGRDARRPLPARLLANQEMFALDDLARVFELTVREDLAAGGVTVAARGQTIVLSVGQPLASVGGRLVSLGAAPVREGRTWFVPADFISRALALALGTRIDVRRPSRLIVPGDVRVPQVAARLESLGGVARLTLDVSPATPHTVSQEGSRLLVRFEADALDPSLPAVSTVPELVASVHAGEAPTTLVVDLGPRFASFRSADSPGDRGGSRLAIDIAAQTTEAAPANPGPTGPPQLPELPPLLDLAPAGGVRTIVIDAGHGGDDQGVTGGAGTLEKTVALSVARRLKGALESRLGVRVILTRDADRSVALDERAAVANNNQADLFISLHANASVRPGIAGAEVFYLSLEAYGEEGQRVAHGDADVLPVFGGGARDIEVTPWELAQARHIEQSAALAQAVDRALREQIPMGPRAIQPAPLRVLIGVNMPAVLVEMAFLTNPQQEKDVATDTFQNAIVQALVNAVVSFRDAPPGTPILPGAPPALAGPGTR